MTAIFMRPLRAGRLVAEKNDLSLKQFGGQGFRVDRARDATSTPRREPFHFLSCEGLICGESGGSSVGSGVARLLPAPSPSDRFGLLGALRSRGAGPGPGRGTISLLVIICPCPGSS